MASEGNLQPEAVSIVREVESATCSEKRRLVAVFGCQCGSGIANR
jgi:hypothetical protein